MNKLRISLSAVTERNGLAVEERIAESALRPSGTPQSSLRSVDITGKVSVVDSEYVFQGRLSGVFGRPCDRCLEPARTVIELEVVWYFEPGVETPLLDGIVEYTEDDAFKEDSDRRHVRFFEGEELDLAPHIWEEMVLATPAKFCCSDECRGLCAKCGANLNKGDCTCALDEDLNHSGLAALKDLFPNSPSETSED